MQASPESVSRALFPSSVTAIAIRGATEAREMDNLRREDFCHTQARMSSWAGGAAWNRLQNWGWAAVGPSRLIPCATSNVPTHRDSPYAEFLTIVAECAEHIHHGLKENCWCPARVGGMLWEMSHTLIFCILSKIKWMHLSPLSVATVCLWRHTALGSPLALRDANNLACRRLAQLLVQSNERSQIRASRWISWEVEKARLLVALKPQVLLPYWLPLMLPMPELQGLPLQMSLILSDQRAASETA